MAIIVLGSINSGAQPQRVRDLYDSPALQAAVVTLQPGQSSEPEKEVHEGSSELMVVVHGSISIRGEFRSHSGGITSKSVHAVAGDCLLIERGTPHPFSTESGVRLLVVYVPVHEY